MTKLLNHKISSSTTPPAPHLGHVSPSSILSQHQPVLLFLLVPLRLPPFHCARMATTPLRLMHSTCTVWIIITIIYLLQNLKWRYWKEGLRTKSLFNLSKHDKNTRRNRDNAVVKRCLGYICTMSLCMYIYVHVYTVYIIYIIYMYIYIYI